MVNAPMETDAEPTCSHMTDALADDGKRSILDKYTTAIGWSANRIQVVRGPNNKRRKVRF